MFKKISALILVFILSLSVISILPVSAASDSEIKLLDDLGIIETEVARTGLFEKSFGKAEFAVALNKLDQNDPANFTSVKEDAVPYAADISGHVNYNDIATLIALGYMELDENGNFNPSSPLTYTDAVKALVRALGYEPIAKKNGGTDAEYLALAQKIGLLKGLAVADKNSLTAYETAELLANSMSIRFFSEGNINLEDACFYDEWDLTKRSGRVIANTSFGIYGDKVSYGKVNIDGKIYETDLFISDETVGCEVDYYTTSGKFTDKVVSINIKKSSDNITMEAGKILDVKENAKTIDITYGKNEDEITIEKTAYVVVNGKTVSPTSELFEAFKSGTVTFVDSDNDQTYDVVHMTAYFQTIVEGVNPINKTFTTRDVTDPIDLDDYDSVEIYVGKNVASINEIKADMAIGIACDSFTIEDGEFVFDFANASLVKLNANNRIAAGVVDSVDGDRVSISEVSYKLGSAYNRYVDAGVILPVEVGSYINAYVDAYGEITYYTIDTENDSMKYGYLIAAMVDTRTPFGRRLKLRILTENGDIINVATGETVILDKEKVDANATFYAVGADNVDLAQRQIIKYRLVDDIVKEIDTTAQRPGKETEDNSLTTYLHFDPAGHEARDGVFNREFAITGDTICFIDDANPTDAAPSDDSFAVSALSATRGTYKISGYDANEDKVLTAIVNHTGYTVEGESATQNSPMAYHTNFCYLVKEVAKAVDQKGKEGWELSLIGNGKEATVFAPEDTLKLTKVDETKRTSMGDNPQVIKLDAANIQTEIQAGDIIRYQTNAFGDVNLIERMFDFSATEALDMPYLMLPDGSGHAYSYVKVERAIPDIFFYKQPDEGSDVIYLAKQRVGYSTQATVYDVNKKKAYLTSIEKVPTAATGNNVKCFMRTYDNGRLYDYIFYVFE